MYMSQSLKNTEDGIMYGNAVSEGGGAFFLPASPAVGCAVGAVREERRKGDETVEGEEGTEGCDSFVYIRFFLRIQQLREMVRVS
jgi:hypothetical protein